MTSDVRKAAAEQQFDVVIAGAGMVGATLGVALAGAGLKVALVDRITPAQMTDLRFDGRTSAIAHGSKLALERLGVWQEQRLDACPIEAIRVSDGPSLLHLHFDPHQLGPGGEGRAPPFGYIVENRFLRRALHETLASRPGAATFMPHSLLRLEQEPGRVRAYLEDGRLLEATLCIVAEGKQSALREALGIRLARFDYGQTAIVCSVMHAEPHRNVAQERFLPAGPFAILPMSDDQRGRHRSSIVWTEKAVVAPRLMALDEAAFARELQRRFGDYLGSVAPIGGRWSFPLALQHAERYAAGRVCLAGDAAHAIHPIAGQGLNLGLRDAAALAEVVVDAARLGLDIGAPQVLGQYQAWRRFDIVSLSLVTDALNRLFSNDVGPLRLARDLGLGGVNRIAPLKRFFMRHAMGVLGDLPRLIRGEAL